MNNIERQLFDLILNQETERIRDIEVFSNIFNRYGEAIRNLSHVLQKQTERINELEARLFAKEHTYK